MKTLNGLLKINVSPFGGGWGRLIPFILMLVLTSCDPCPDCGVSARFEPTVEMIFINQDSVNSINDSLSVFAFNDSSLNANIDSLLLLNDSLQIIVDSIERGGMLLNEKMNIEEWIALRRLDSLFYATLNKEADSLSALFNQTKASIASGLMKIDELTIIETGESVSYSDSSASWNFPLLFDENSVLYEFIIDKETYSIALGYETYTEMDQQRNVLVRATHISVIESSENFITLDSCNVTCEDSNATFTFYF